MAFHHKATIEVGNESKGEERIWERRIIIRRFFMSAPGPIQYEAVRDFNNTLTKGALGG